MKSATTRDRARRDAGEPSGADPVGIDAALAALETRSIQELRAEWRELYRVEPPRRLSRDLLVRGIAYRLQEQVHGGLDPATRRRLAALAGQLKAKGPSHFDPGITLKPGTRLIREWHGHTHAVIVLEHGFEYQGQRHRSLTGIARLITGAHQSGPVFFGLKKRPRAPDPAP